MHFVRSANISSHVTLGFLGSMATARFAREDDDVDQDMDTRPLARYQGQDDGLDQVALELVELPDDERLIEGDFAERGAGAADEEALARDGKLADLQ